MHQKARPRPAAMINPNAGLVSSLSSGEMPKPSLPFSKCKVTMVAFPISKDLESGIMLIVNPLADLAHSMEQTLTKGSCLLGEMHRAMLWQCGSHQEANAIPRLVQLRTSLLPFDRMTRNRHWRGSVGEGPAFSSRLTQRQGVGVQPLDWRHLLHWDDQVREYGVRTGAASLH